MTQVFISYTRRGDYDRQFADYLRGQLTAWGYRPWMDVYDIPSGDHWDDAIDTALKASDVVLGLMTPASVDSDNVKNEWAWALQKDKLQLILLAPCDIPHRFIRIDYIDFTKDQNAGMERLHKILSTPSLHSSTTSTGIRQGSPFKRISGTVKAVPQRVNQVAASTGLPRGLLLGGLIGAGLVVIACLAFIVVALWQEFAPNNYAFNNPGGGNGDNATNAEAFVHYLFNGDLTSAASMVCPEYRGQLNLEMSQVILYFSSIGGVSIDNLQCRAVSDSAVDCDYNLFSFGFSEPVNIRLPMSEGLVCTPSLSFISAPVQQQ